MGIPPMDLLGIASRNFFGDCVVYYSRNSSGNSSLQNLHTVYKFFQIFYVFFRIGLIISHTYIPFLANQRNCAV